MLQDVKDIQNRAVEKLVSLFNDGRSNKELTFKAPTGSGKTYMMADFMNRILDEHQDIIFIVSTLSKGNLAEQNFEKFEEYKDSYFTKINPYIISSEISGEERLFIPETYNVYVLPRDLYKEGGRLKRGSMNGFLEEIKWKQKKRIVLIKDECHIATSNLDELSTYWDRIINFSATPNLTRKQYPDVNITEQEAVNAQMIKCINWGDDKETVEDAINKYLKIKQEYLDCLSINPCLIIQISNKNNAESEWVEIKKALDKNPDLKWMYIVDKEKDCDTNENFKSKKLKVEKWKQYAKQNKSLIDIIIFKMVISEGWDIPRACMLFQMRDSKSKQMDEQVMGRVRRNPILLNFENYSPTAQKLATACHIWGIKSEEQKKIIPITLQDANANIQVKTTKLKSLSEKSDFSISDWLGRQQTPVTYKSIFNAYKDLSKIRSEETQKMCWNFADTYEKWQKIAEFALEIDKESNAFLHNYANSMDVNLSPVSFSLVSHFTETNYYERISDWVWKKKDEQDEFSFDSKAEKEWAYVLKVLSNKFSKIIVKDLFGNESKEIALWGKNFLPNSLIKFQYYNKSGIHNSYPDFIMKDKKDRVHIFEVKSVNIGKIGIDNEEYKQKVLELEECFIEASKKTSQLFYLPILRDAGWQIFRYNDGIKDTLTKSMFENSF